MATPSELSARLREAADKETVELWRISETDASEKTGDAWSRKEELGHLIDSASNNHQRFVRGALEAGHLGPGYAQNEWVRIHAYQTMPWESLVRLWHGYNSLLAHLVAQIPAEALEGVCTYGEYGPFTLGYIIDDYILHMRHHLDHILRRETVTRYPRA